MTELGKNLESPGSMPQRFSYTSWEEGLRRRPGEALIPRAYLDRELLDGFEVRATFASIDRHIKVPVWRIRLRRKNFDERKELLRDILTATVGEGDLLFAMGQVASRTLPMVLSERFKGIVEDSEIDDLLRREGIIEGHIIKEVLAAMREECKPVIDRLARVMGREIRLHVLTPKAILPSDDKGPLHIFAEASPSGDVKQGAVTPFLVGNRLRADGSNMNLVGMTQGRGGVIRDPIQGFPMAQVVEGNWYLLYPFIHTLNRSTSGTILDKVLAETWGTLRLVDSPLARKALTKEVFAVEYDAWLHLMEQSTEGKMRRAEERIAELQKQLADMLMMRRQLTAAHEALVRGFAQSSLPEEIEAQWEELEQYASGEVRAEVVEDGIQFYTGNIVAPYGDAEYDLGSYVIRYAFISGNVTVWSLKGTHPDGAIHPHIPRTGTPCFGNATMAIVEAGGNMRVARMVEMVLRWLKYGYDEAVADRPITEWPLVTKEVNHG